MIPHQANLRISQFIQKKFGLTDDQVYNNIQKYGNTTAASIPIALTEAGELKLVTLLFSCFWKWFYMGKCYHKMVVILMSIESSYEYKTWNLNIPGFFYDDIFTTNFIKFHY
jgi:hypothetical protein